LNLISIKDWVFNRIVHLTYVKALKTEGEMSNKKRSLIDRLNSGPVICAEGFLFEIE